MTNDDLIAALRQQVMALASISGVLLAALRQGGVLTPEMEALLAGGLVDAAAEQSEQVRPNWETIVSAVQKVSSAALGAAVEGATVESGNLLRNLSTALAVFSFP